KRRWIRQVLQNLVTNTIFDPDGIGHDNIWQRLILEHNFAALPEDRLERKGGGAFAIVQGYIPPLHHKVAAGRRAALGIIDTPAVIWAPDNQVVQVGRD